MNGRERFLTALRRQQPDRVPVWELIVNEPTRSAWGATSLEEFVEAEDLDTGLTQFPAVDSAVFSEDGVDEERLLRVTEMLLVVQ